MSSAECHIRHLIESAAKQRSHQLIDDAFALIEEGFDRFSCELSPSLLVTFAEVASDLREREAAVARALDLYDALNCEEDQFKVRALLVRCVVEARLGSEGCQLKGPHLLQQLRYALGFLMQALGIATKPGNDARYGFLVYNASLVFWDVVRPMCRVGWQRHIVEETTDVLEKLKVVSRGAGGASSGKDAKGGGSAAVIPCPVNPVWLVELTLNLAFGLEDAGKPDGEVQKRAEEASQFLAEALKLNPDLETSEPRLKSLVLSARAHFARKAPGKAKEEIDKASGSTVVGTVLFVRNGGITKEASEEELIKAWTATDKDFDLRAARDAFDPYAQASKHREKVGLTPSQVIDLCTVLRAACSTERWKLALAMRERLLKCNVPPGRGRVLLDIAKCELDVHQACTLKHEDPATKMLLAPDAQRRLELEARVKAVRLCEQCIMTAQRINEVDLVEESACAMWNIGRELMFADQRVKIRQSLSRCAEILDEVNSVRLMQLRVQLHFEVACCEIAQDLLTKGQQELSRAQALDYTVQESDLAEPSKKYLAEKQEVDLAPYVRRFDAQIEERSHLLRWKQSIYEDPTDVVDQVTLTLDQAQKKGAKSTFKMLVLGFGKLETALDALRGEKREAMKGTFVPPPRHITSADALSPLPHHAPATVRVGGQADAQVRDLRPRSEQEEAVERAKKVVSLICRVGVEAFRAEQYDFAVRACDRALEAAAEVHFGPPPVEAEGAILLAEAAYVKAQCLSKGLADLGVINGIDDEMEEEDEDEAAAKVDADGAEAWSDGEEEPRLTAEQQQAASGKKRALIEALLLGIEKSHEFEQWWMVANGLALWWNLHLELVSQAHDQPKLLKRALPEYGEGLKRLQKYLHGEAALPRGDFQSLLAAHLLLAHVDASLSAGQLGALETEQLLVVKRLEPSERKMVVARVTDLCKARGKPLPELARLRPERLDATPPAGGKEEKGKKGKDAPAAPVQAQDKSDLLGQEADVMQAVMSIPHAPSADEARKLVDQAVQILSGWEPRQNDEAALTLWVELWTRLGRKCTEKPMHPNVGAKYALMCGIKALGDKDAPAPKHAAKLRLSWTGAAHALCGDVFARLVDPQKQEKDSIARLRSMSVEQYQRCCEYAQATRSTQLAVNAAANLWNVALPMLLSAETRQLLLEPLQAAARALAGVGWSDDPHFLVGIYQAIFDGYSDAGRWDRIHEVLNEAFQAVPVTGQRQLWAMRMLALSRQGKNIAVAMGKMKETQAKPQAKIWLTLADASSKRSDQLDAYSKAIDILQEAQQPDVVEVRMQFADWLLRNGFGPGDALDQLAAAADILLDVEPDMDEDNDETDDGQSEASRSTGRSGRSEARTRKTRGSASSRQGSKTSAVGSRGAGTKSTGRKSAGRRTATLSSKKSSARSSRMRRQTDEDADLPEQLCSHHYDALCRIYAMRGRLTVGPDMHGALLSAARFAVRFFASTVELANACARQLAAAMPEPALAGEQGEGSQAISSRRPSKVRKSRTSVVGTTVDPDKVALVNILPSFAVPARLSEWAFPHQCAWSMNGSALPQMIAQAEQEGMLPASVSTWVGHQDAFTQPTLTFHLSVQLQSDLEEQGYHLWVLPVVSLQLKLAEAFDDPVRSAVSCLAHMRLSRVAQECGMAGADAAAREKWQAAVHLIPDSFGGFEEELEQVRSQRAGRAKGGAGGLDPAWSEGGGGHGDPGRPSCAWLCSELHTYEVWAELARECMLRGELWMASRLSDEAIRHARVYGDGRTLRGLLITRARLACIEGNSPEVIKTLKDVSTSDPRQLADVAILLADAYHRQRMPVVVDEVLKEALNALESSVEDPGITVKNGADGAVGRGPSAPHAAARAAVRSRLLHAELEKLWLPVPAQRWKADMGSAILLYESICNDLSQASLYRQRLLTCISFVEALLELIEAKQALLLREPAADGLDCRMLEGYAMKACEFVQASWAQRRLMLSLTVPLEGAGDGVVLPSELLVARLDVCQARAGSVRRALAAARSAEEARRAAAGKRRASQEGLFTIGPSVDRHEGPVLDRTLTEEQRAATEQVAAWLDDMGEQLAAEEKKRSRAREMSEAEVSMALVANAASLRPPGGTAGAVEPSAAQAETLVELGLLQLELALLQAPRGATVAQRWEPPGPDRHELHGMEVAERCSNALGGRDPGAVFSTAVASEEADDKDKDKKGAGGKKGKEDAAAKAKAKAKAAPEPPKEEAPPPEEKPAEEPRAEPAEVDFDRAGKETLCAALRAALAARRFGAARRACGALATQGWGAHNQEATFEFLVWAQSADVCARAEDAFQLLLPEDHRERAQAGLLRWLEGGWRDPAAVDAYRSVRNRLLLESPLFQRLQLLDLPPIRELLLSYLPPLTLVVTLQLHGDHLYLGAACSPPEGERAQRQQLPLRHLARRFQASQAELSACARRLQELHAAIEKELLAAPELSEALAAQHRAVVDEAERALLAPLARELAVGFWPLGAGLEHPSNPRQLVLLPDSLLWGLPLESSAALLGLFGAGRPGALSRDFSLHAAAFRVRGFVEPAPESERRQVQTKIPGFRPSSTVLLTDAFDEDAPHASEDPRAETMCAFHDRLVDSKAIGNGARSIHGQKFCASPADISAMLADSSAFLSLGFGRFFATMSASDFASQSLKTVSLLALFYRAANGGSFRRQAKSDSQKAARQRELESAYGTPLIAAFRGAQCTVLASGPVPTALSIKALEIFARALAAGKAVAQAMEEVMLSQVDADQRYVRALGSSEAPAIARTKTRPQKQQVEKRISTEKPSPGESDTVELLPWHTRSVYMVVGAPWVSSEEGPAETGKPPKKK